MHNYRPSGLCDRLDDAKICLMRHDKIHLAGGDAALVHHLHGRTAVLMYDGENDLVLAHNRIHMEDLAGHELLHQEEALPVSKLIKSAPKLFRLFDLPNSQ